MRVVCEGVDLKPGCSKADCRACVPADRKSNMQYMRALFVSEEPEQDIPEKMSGLLKKHTAHSERRSHGPRIVGLAGSDVTKASPVIFCRRVMCWMWRP